MIRRCQVLGLVLVAMLLVSATVSAAGADKPSICPFDNVVVPKSLEKLDLFCCAKFMTGISEKEYGECLVEKTNLMETLNSVSSNLANAEDASLLFTACVQKAFQKSENEPNLSCLVDGHVVGLLGCKINAYKSFENCLRQY